MRESFWWYSRPFSHDLPIRIESDSPGHYGPFCHAVDFLMPYDTLVLAPRDGKVVALKDDGRLWGPKEKFAPEANYVTLSHGQNEFSQLVHLKHKGVLVRVGQHVGEDEPLGLTGPTGWLYEPHLHFMVFHVFPDGSFQSVKIRWKDPLWQ